MRKILVVDDNSDICTLLRLTFEGAGHEVVSTQDALEAFRMIELHRPDAVVLDVMMPARLGWDVLQEIRQSPQSQDVPVVLLTALADVTDRVRGLRGGADDYQTKPFDPEEILARVEGLIARRIRLATASPPTVSPPTVSPPTALSAPPAGAPSMHAAAPLEQAIAELERRLSAREDLAAVCLGRYEVRNLLGRGAMGTVLDGWDPKLQRRVALKTIRYQPEALASTDRRQRATRLIEEAVVSARLNHPNIVTVYDAGEEGTAAFIAMELVEGVSLEDHLEQRGKLGAEQVIPLAVAMARALAAAHRHEIVHRDIKPANVLLGHDGSIKVTDFGISEFFSQRVSGSIFGTPGYLAPETLAGKAASQASDLFSLGVTLYECLTGRNPFVEKSWRRTLKNTVAKDARPLREIVPAVSSRVDAAISRLLAKKPAERPQTAAEVAELFGEISAAQALRWSPETPPTLRRRYRVSTTRSRLVTLDTLSRTLDLSAASA